MLLLLLLLLYIAFHVRHWDINYCLYNKCFMSVCVQKERSDTSICPKSRRYFYESKCRTFFTVLKNPPRNDSLGCYIIIVVFFCVAYSNCNPHLVIIRKLSPCRVVHGEDWVSVSGRVGHLGTTNSLILYKYISFNQHQWLGVNFGLIGEYGELQFNDFILQQTVVILWYKVMSS